MRGEDDAQYEVVPEERETPPRAWGRQQFIGGLLCSGGNTPTCVGKTAKRRVERVPCRKHPHVRGEDPVDDVVTVTCKETPPRAWGRLCRPRKPIPTDETPPRAWGRLIQGHRDAWPDRNTPTCVGKTRPHPIRGSDMRKHPHVRGEDRKSHLPACSMETPPRAWGRLLKKLLSSSRPRNTPTCVGKTGTTSP